MMEGDSTVVVPEMTRQRFEDKIKQFNTFEIIVVIFFLFRLSSCPAFSGLVLGSPYYRYNAMCSLLGTELGEIICTS